MCSCDEHYVLRFHVIVNTQERERERERERQREKERVIRNTPILCVTTCRAFYVNNVHGTCSKLCALNVGDMSRKELRTCWASKRQVIPHKLL